MAPKKTPNGSRHGRRNNAGGRSSNSSSAGAGDAAPDLAQEYGELATNPDTCVLKAVCLDATPRAPYVQFLLLNPGNLEPIGIVNLLVEDNETVSFFTPYDEDRSSHPGVEIIVIELENWERAQHRDCNHVIVGITRSSSRNSQSSLRNKIQQVGGI